MSDELELLDQLLGHNEPLAVMRQLFSSTERFVRAATAMLTAGDIRLLDEDGIDIPAWRWRQVLAEQPLAPYFLSITDQGVKRFSL